MADRVERKNIRAWTRDYKKKQRVTYRFAEGMRIRKIVLRVLSVVLAIAVVLGSLWFYAYLQLDRAVRPTLNNLGLTPAIAAIAQDAGEVVVADNEWASLVLDPATLNIRLEDKASNLVWNLQNPDENANSAVKSLFNIEFLGENGELTEWNTHTYSVAGQNYDIEQIEDGVRLTLHISQGASIRFDDYMPRRISIERYETLFLEALDRLKDDGTIDASEHTILNLALQTAYRRNVDEDIYYLNYVGNPPTSTVRRMIEVAQVVGYTYDDLIADNETHGILMEERENPEFSIPLELTLDQGDLIARVPAAEVDNKNPYYQLQSVALLPNLALADASLYREGQMLVPDGSGALIPFNQASSNYPAYSRQFRDSNYYDTYYFADNYSQKMSMPIFGMIYGGEEDTERAILGIVEEGSVLGGIRAVQANTSSELQDMSLNRIYTEVDLTQFARINVYGPYSMDDARYLVSTGMQDMNYQVRYKTFGRDTSYYDMAKAYQSYLMLHGVGQDVDQSYKDLKAHLEFLATIEIDKRLVGIPYESKHSMTTYKDLSEILSELDEEQLLLTYKGAFSGGYNQDLLREAKLESTNGSRTEWEHLQDDLNSFNSKISLEANFSRISGRQAGFVPRTHGIKAFDTYSAYIYEYDPMNGRFDQDSYNYVRISPWYLDSIVSAFLEDAKPAEVLTVSDLARDFFADYNERHPLSAYEADLVVQEALSDLSSSYDLVLADGFMDYAGHASLISHVGRSSSQYASFAEDIPFRQLVLNGLVPYSTETINMSAYPTEYFLLQVAEVAAIPQFTLTADSAEIFKELSYRGFYSTEFSAHQTLISDVLSEVDSIREEIGSEILVDHVQVEDKVFLSTYDNGTQVLTNYNEYQVDYDGHQIPALAYLILRGSEGSGS